MVYYRWIYDIVYPKENIKNDAFLMTAIISKVKQVIVVPTAPQSNFILVASCYQDKNDKGIGDYSSRMTPK